ncbi:MAG: pectinacetylesterase family protein [Proteobacteria bacterium]|nr:pectinacetylesterase family protein [Pseudomonadota bacterium]
MRRRLLSAGLSVVLAAGLCPLAGASAVAEEEAAPAPVEWRRIEPGGETGCGDGSPYAFFWREGASDRLLIFLQGGGACWSAATCGLTGAPTYDPNVQESDSPAVSGRGILDLSRPENPLAEYSAVFLPYCSGDVHLGQADRTYPVVGEGGVVANLSVAHRGAANGRAVLEWTYAHFPDVERVFVAGHSAGGLAAPVYAAWVAHHYGRRAQVTQLSDGSGALRAAAVPDLMQTWGVDRVVADTPGFGDIPPEALDFEALFAGAARGLSERTWAQVNRSDDLVQIFFPSLLGRQAVRALELFAEGQRRIRAEVPEFRAFTAPGRDHHTLTSDEFYTLIVDGVRLREWVGQVATGEPVSDVLCKRCRRPRPVAAPPPPPP